MEGKVYGIDPLICSKCGSEMRIVAFIITDLEQIERIIKHLVKQGRAAYCSLTLMIGKTGIFSRIFLIANRHRPSFVKPEKKI